MSLQSLIDELEQLMDRSMHIPASGKVLVDEPAVRHIIDQLRLNTSDEAKIAKRLAGEREKVLAEARAQARRIIEDAQAQGYSRLEGESAVQAARERARQIIEDAEQQAGRVRGDANTYVANQFSALESRLQRVLHEVQAGQRYLTQPPADRSGAAETRTQS